MSENNLKKNEPKKFLFPLIGFFVSLMIFAVIYLLSILQRNLELTQPIIPTEYADEFVNILPGNLLTDSILLFLFPIVIFGIFYLISPYTTVFFLKLHQSVYRSKKKYNYGIIDLNPKVKPFMLFRRSLIVSLFSFSITGLIVQIGGRRLFRYVETPDLPEILLQAEALFLGCFLIISFVLIIFLPIWLLEDSGIVICRLYSDRRKPPIIEGTHSLFLNFLQGYAGLSTLATLIYLIGGTLGALGKKETGLDWAMLTPIILIVLPVLLTGLIAFPVYLYEKSISKLLERIKPKLETLNLSEIRIPSFEEMQSN